MPTADSYERMKTGSRNTRNTRDTISVAPSAAGRYNQSPASTGVNSYTPVTNYASGGGGGGSYDSYSGGGGFAPMAAPAPPPPPTEEDYLAGDGGYQAQLAALMKALELYTADDTAQRTRYETDYKDAIKQLGWTPDDPQTADIDESAWNLEDQNTASGRAHTGQLNDFASRGMLQSSGYARRKNDLMRSFNDQLGSTNKARTDFLSQRDRDLAAYKNENTGASQQARAEALARRAAQYGL